MAEFIGGLQLSRLFYQEVVEPMLAGAFPHLNYAAALLGPGSEVLGYDTVRSTDHDWGPRLQLFLSEEDHAEYAHRMEASLQLSLPATFHGYPCRFRRTHEGPDEPVKHRVKLHTVDRFFAAALGFNPSVGIQPADWLVTPEQTLLELTAGAVFHDGPGALTAKRAQLSYYPTDVWLYRMAAQWQRVAQQEAFMGRAGEVGDELGSRLIAASLVRELMRLCFAIERQYAPYSKWLGMAFARLACAPVLGPLLERTLQAERWSEREARLAEAYAAVMAQHNGLGITPPIATAVSRYYDRPYLVIHADRLVSALREAIEDPALRTLPLYGASDQLSDSTDFLTSAEFRQRLSPLY